MKPLSICISCGESKGSAKSKCNKCGYKPNSDNEIAKSFILSEAFDVNEIIIGKTRKELELISLQIKDGSDYKFSDSEITKVKKEIKSFLNTSKSVLLLELLRWLGPALGFIAVIFFIIWLNNA